MARPTKVGISYFPYNVDFYEDEKTEFIPAKYGLIGEAITARLLERIYRNGYLTKWDEDVKVLFVSKLRAPGCDNLSEIVDGVITELLKRDFFSKELFDKYKVLTGRGIQKRYLKICADAKRKHSVISHEYNLIDEEETPKVTTFELFPEETPITTGVIPEETTINTGNAPEFSTQSKVKKTIENKSKEEETKADETPYFFTFSNFNDLYFLQAALNDMIGHYCWELDITKSVRTRLFNIISESVFPRDRCYKIALNVFIEYKDFTAEQKNFRYLFSRIEGKIEDAIIIYREELAELDKNKEKIEAEKMLHNNEESPPGEESFSSILKGMINSKSIAEKKV
ncbi:MAG: DUF4373 domain-containing protein [Ignavibacteriaceae bacterium]|jgi:hypothetical protein|nr:DUF4373 domain-containing protein [Ignavibacteriaceae bacterium]